MEMYQFSMASTTRFLEFYDDLQMDLSFQIQTQMGKSHSGF